MSMSSNVFNEIKNDYTYKTKIKPVTNSSLVINDKTTGDLEKVIQPGVVIKNKLITCYEEDYTRNSNDIMRLWQRN